MGDRESATRDGPLDLAVACGTGPSTVLVLSVDASSLKQESWTVGPLPVRQPATVGRASNGQPTNETTRRTLIGDQPANVLYGPDGRRLHRFEERRVGELTVMAEEVWIDERSPLAYLMLHVRANRPADLAAHLNATSAIVRETSRLGVMLGGQTSPVTGVSHVESSTRVLSFVNREPNHESLFDAYVAVTMTREESWGDASTRSQTHSLTIDRPDWSALVLRDGAALVAHQTSSEDFRDSLRMQCHTVYLDALLLALVQRRKVDDSSRRATDASLMSPDELTAIEADHFEFKQRYWRTALTLKRTSPLDKVLGAFQDELLTHADFSDVENRVRDGARLAQSLRDQQAKRDQDRLERTVQNVSAVVGSFGLAYTAAAVVTDPTWWVFLAASAVGLVGMLLCFAGLAVVRSRTGATRSG